MGYYMRFVIDDEKKIALSQVLRGLKDMDRRYRFDGWNQTRDSVDFYHGDELLGELDLYGIEPGEPDEEIEDLIEDAHAAGGPHVDQIVSVLDEARNILAIRVLWQNREQEETLSRIDPLWDWLFAHYSGILHTDDGEFYNAEGLLSGEE